MNKPNWPGRERWAKLWNRIWGQYRYMLLVLAAGLLLLALPSGESRAGPEPVQSGGEEETFDLSAFEAKLAGALSRIEGAGEVQVVLTLKGGSRQVLAQEVEQDGQRLSTAPVRVGRGSSSQEVVALQTLSPQFQGALVVCPGGSDPAVRLQLMDAVCALTGLGSDRISICPGTPPERRTK